jgi:hypothetical protein
MNRKLKIALISILILVVMGGVLIFTRDKILDSAVMDLKMNQTETAINKLSILGFFGDQIASLTLAEIYGCGIGVRFNLEKAKYWRSQYSSKTIEFNDEMSARRELFCH